MNNIDSQVNSISGLVVFDAEYLQDTVTSAAIVTLAAGTLLKRVGTSLEVADSGDQHIAVLPAELDFTAAGTKSIKVITAGKLDREKLNANGNPLSIADVDSLRSFGITAISRQQLSELDNS